MHDNTRAVLMAVDENGGVASTREIRQSVDGLSSQNAYYHAERGVEEGLLVVEERLTIENGLGMNRYRLTDDGEEIVAKLRDDAPPADLRERIEAIEERQDRLADLVTENRDYIVDLFEGRETPDMS